MTNPLGKRFTCTTCGAEVLCTKAGEGVVTCCDKPMELKQPAALPTAD